MDFFDVVFPLNIGPLTYRWNPERGRILPGMVVRAEVQKRLRCGMVLGTASRRPEGPLKEIIAPVLEQPLLSDSLISLLRWMSEYYLVPEGVVLKAMLPKELFEERDRKKRKTVEREGKLPANQMALPEISPDTLSPVRSSLSAGGYKAFLLSAPTTLYEISHALEAAKETRNVIVLSPEMTLLELLEPAMRDLFGPRLAVLHGKLSKAARMRTIDSIIRGDADVVLGTRLAVIAPLRPASLIWVLQEHNRSYKGMEGIRYHGRDVAVMRGYIEKATVVLSSTAPSFESLYNVRRRKYTPIEVREKVRRPKIAVIDMKTAKKAAPYLSARALDGAAASVRKREGVLFFINRKGYSMIQCAECSTVESCPRCGIPLVLHRNEKALRCHYCNHSEPVIGECRVCRGTRLEAIGAGTERIVSDLKKYLEVEPLRFDSDALRSDPTLKTLSGVLKGDEIVVGTRAVTGMLRKRGAFELCVFLNPDTGLHLPDFRSSENLFQEIVGISEYAKPEGILMVQTRLPESDLFRYIRSYGYADFYRAELAKRRALAYPPFSSLIALRAVSDNSLRERFLDALATEGPVEVIGPIETIETSRSGASEKTGPGRYVCKALLKSADKKRLRAAARDLMEKLRGEKGVKVVADVDPISL